MSVFAMIVGLAVFAGSATAQDGGGGAVIDADVTADIAVEGGDAQGGNAQGGNAVVSLEAGNTSGCGCGSQVAVSQTVDQATGGAAVGGDAAGGDGINANIDANLVVDADVALDVTADVDVTTGVAANATLPGGGVSTLAASEAPAANGAAQLPTDGLSGTPDLGGLLNPLLGGLGGLQLLDLTADIVLDVAGGEAVGGNAAGGNAVVALQIGDTSGRDGSQVAVAQHVGAVTGGLALGGDATGGDGIELDIVLDADVDLVVDAVVVVDVDVTTFAEVEAAASSPSLLSESSDAVDGPAELGNLRVQ